MMKDLWKTDIGKLAIIGGGIAGLISLCFVCIVCSALLDPNASFATQEIAEPTATELEVAEIAEPTVTELEVAEHVNSNGYLSGGLGLSRSDWEQNHTKTGVDSESAGTLFYDYKYKVLFLDGNVRRVTRVWNPPVTTEEMAVETKSLIPLDSVIIDYGGVDYDDLDGFIEAPPRLVG